jgi:hypothetical protein
LLHHFGERGGDFVMRKELLIVLVILCLAAVLFMAVPVGSLGTYDPWLDSNGDGKRARLETNSSISFPFLSLDSLEARARSQCSSLRSFLFNDQFPLGGPVKMNVPTEQAVVVAATENHDAPHTILIATWAVHAKTGLLNFCSIVSL